MNQMLKKRGSLSPRDPTEVSRTATPLELLFDLVSVIAIAVAAAGLHHAIAANHTVDGLIHFFAAFFMIWLAWLNYTWYASAYDNDDIVFRLLTMLSMAGSLIIAAGIGAFFESNDLLTILIGFVVMRIAMAAFWLRAAIHDLAHRKTALWYAGGIVVVQGYWVLMIVNQPASPALFYALFGLGALAELSIPVLAERQGQTPWHRHHIIERYGLLNIIVLGETLLAASMAFREARDDGFNTNLIGIGIAALVILFSLWWLYFSREDHLQDDSRELAFVWGYGHFLIFISGAAVGAGIAVQTEIATGQANVSALVGNVAVGLPVALYVFGLWLVRDRLLMQGAIRFVMPALAALMLLLTCLFGMEVLIVLLPLTVWLRHWACRRSLVFSNNT